MPSDWGLLALEPTTLGTLFERPLTFPPLGLGAAPDGSRAYALDGLGAAPRSSAAGKTRLMAIDLATGTVSLLAEVPGPGTGSRAVARDHICVPDPERNTVWMVDRLHGRPAASIPVGQGPSGIGVAGRAVGRRV